MGNFAIGILSRNSMTLCPHIQYTGSLSAAVAMYKKFNPPLSDDDLYISPYNAAVETALAANAGRLVVVGGTYNAPKAVFVADTFKVLEMT